MPLDDSADCTQHFVVPICPSIEDGGTRENAAQLAQKVINQQVAKGWTFVQLGTMQVQINPGCLGRLIGRTSVVEAMTVAVFSRTTGGVQPQPGPTKVADYAPGRKEGESLEAWGKRVEQAEIAAYKAKSR